MNLRCLTLHQPWASLLVAGVKHFETRSWNPSDAGSGGPFAAAFGVVAIHSAKTAAWDHVREKEPYREALARCGILESDELPHGAILGTAEFVAVHPAVAIANAAEFRPGAPKNLEIRLGNFAPGRWAWEFRRAKCFGKPVPWRGAQGFWTADIQPIHLSSDDGVASCFNVPT